MTPTLDELDAMEFNDIPIQLIPLDTDDTLLESSYFTDQATDIDLTKETPLTWKRKLLLNRI